MARKQIWEWQFAEIYPMYVQKVAKKGRSKEDLHTVITWLTGYDEAGLEEQIARETTFAQFFDEAPQLHANVGEIKGLVCGVRVEDIEDPLTQKVRWLDKLVDELARGKKMASILR
jgi:hypothetical protein